MPTSADKIHSVPPLNLNAFGLLITIGVWLHMCYIILNNTDGSCSLIIPNCHIVAPLLGFADTATVI